MKYYSHISLNLYFKFKMYFHLLCIFSCNSRQVSLSVWLMEMSRHLVDESKVVEGQQKLKCMFFCLLKQNPLFCNTTAFWDEVIANQKGELLFEFCNYSPTYIKNSFSRQNKYDYPEPECSWRAVLITV